MSILVTSSSELDYLQGFPPQSQGTNVTDEMYGFSNAAEGAKDVRVVELSPRDVKDATRLLSLLLAGEPPAERRRNLQSVPDKNKLIDLAKKIFSARQRRSQVFNASLFGEAAWDMLLLLYICDVQGPRLTVSRLAKFAGIAATTALRWLHTLENQQLIARQPHPHDARSSFVQLTDKGVESLEVYLSETLASDS